MTTTGAEPERPPDTGMSKPTESAVPKTAQLAQKKAKTNNSAAQEATEGDASTEATDSAAQETTEGDASTEATKAPQGTGAEGRKQQNRRQDMKPPGGHPNTKAADPTTQATWQRTHTISLVGVFRKVASVLGTPPGTTEALAGVLNRSKIIADITAQDDPDLYATKQLRAALHGCSERILVVAGTSKPPYTNEAAATEESAPEGTFGDDDMVDILCKLQPHYKHCISGNVGQDSCHTVVSRGPTTMKDTAEILSKSPWFMERRIVVIAPLATKAPEETPKWMVILPTQAPSTNAISTPRGDNSFFTAEVRAVLASKAVRLPDVYHNKILERFKTQLALIATARKANTEVPEQLEQCGASSLDALQSELEVLTECLGAFHKARRLIEDDAKAASSEDGGTSGPSPKKGASGPSPKKQRKKGATGQSNTPQPGTVTPQAVIEVYQRIVRNLGMSEDLLEPSKTTTSYTTPLASDYEEALLQGKHYVVFDLAGLPRRPSACEITEHLILRSLPGWLINKTPDQSEDWTKAFWPSPRLEHDLQDIANSTHKGTDKV